MVFSEGITLRESHLCQGALQSRLIVMYWNSPFGPVRLRRAERDLLSRCYLSGECAAKLSSPEQ